MAHLYTILAAAAAHTCWDSETSDGRIAGLLDEACSACAQAKALPCRFCGYGHVFTTHSPTAHYDSNDPTMPAEETDVADEWITSPHLYGQLRDILVSGSPFDGFVVTGPFLTPEEAAEYARANMRGTSWWTSTMSFLGDEGQLTRATGVTP